MADWTLSPEITNFANAARHFCEFIEMAHRYTLGERFLRCAALLANLYAAGLYLPELDEPPDHERQPPVPEMHDWPGFEELTMFWQVADPYDWEAPTVNSLSETLLSAYRDVKCGLLLYDDAHEAGDADLLAYAAWFWQHSMDERWSTNAVDSLRALNRGLQKLSEDG